MPDNVVQLNFYWLLVRTHHGAVTLEVTLWCQLLTKLNFFTLPAGRHTPGHLYMPKPAHRCLELIFPKGQNIEATIVRQKKPSLCNDKFKTLETVTLFLFSNSVEF